MSRVYAGAMITIMALCVFGVALPLGGVTPEVAAPGYMLAALLGVLWAGGLLLAKESTWSHSPMHWPVAIFLAYSAVRYLTSPIGRIVPGWRLWADLFCLRHPFSSSLGSGLVPGRTDDPGCVRIGLWLLAGVEQV